MTDGRNAHEIACDLKRKYPGEKLVGKKDNDVDALSAQAKKLVTDYLSRRTIDPSYGDDIVQNVLMTMMSRFPNFEPEKGAFSTWLMYLCLQERTRYLTNHKKHAGQSTGGFELHDRDSDEVIDSSAESIQYVKSKLATIFNGSGMIDQIGRMHFVDNVPREQIVEFLASERCERQGYALHENQSYVNACISLAKKKIAQDPDLSELLRSELTPEHFSQR